MNAVEIEQAITDLAEQPFDPAEFPYAFLEAFGNKATTLKRLRAGASNKSDLDGVLQTSNIHILTCDAGRVTQTLAALKTSPATAKAKAKFILATDGAHFEAEDLTSGETVACAVIDFPDHFGFFLPLAGISTVRLPRFQIQQIRATLSLRRDLSLQSSLPSRRSPCKLAQSRRQYRASFGAMAPRSGRIVLIRLFFM